MVRVSELAQFVSKAPKDAGELETSAYAVWSAARARAGEPRRSATSGRPGALFHGAMSGIIRQLWPNRSSEEHSALQRDVYQLLRASDNAICVFTGRPGEKKPPTWWIADEWKRPTGVVISRAYRPTSTERRLTPAEAGEDREAAPVTVTSTTPAVKRNPADTLKATHEQRRREREQAKSLVCISVQTHEEPMTAREVQVDSGVERDEGSVRELLNELVNEGKLFMRVETQDERYLRCGGVKRATRSRLYGSAYPVPTRTQRVVVPGVEETPSPSAAPLSREDIRRATARGLRAMIRHKPFTAMEFSEATGINDTTVRRIIGELVENDLITPVKKQRPQTWRISNAQEPAARQYVTNVLGGPAIRLTHKPVPDPAKSETPAAPEEMSTKDALRIITQALENRQPAEDPRVAQLERENAELREKLETIERRMRELFG